MLLKKNPNVMVGILIVLVSFFVYTDQVAGSAANFSVNTNIPTNQIDKSKTYFNLQMSKGQKQDITVTLKNETNKDVTVEIGINSAKTNPNGVIEYGKNDILNDSSLKYPLGDLIKGPSSVVLSANQTQNVTFNVTMPEQTFDGIVLGGLTFQQKTSEVVADTKKQGASVQNEFAYAVAVVLKETDTVVLPNLNLLKVKAGQNNYRNVINATIQNEHAAILSNVKVTANIYAKNGTSPVYSSVKNKMQIAPNTYWNYPISLDGTKMKPGKYRINMVISGTSNNQEKTWNFTKSFNITADEADTLNKTDVNVKANTNNTNWLVIVMALLIILLLLVILIGIFFLQRKKNR